MEPVTFQLVEQGTKHGKTSLVDSLGFTYNVHSRHPYATYWQCKASVTERDGTFQPGKSAHNHAVDMGAVTAAKIISTVKSKALEDKFKPASAIVNELLLEELTEAPCAALPKPEYITRQANRLRQKLSPEHQ